MRPGIQPFSDKLNPTLSHVTRSQICAGQNEATVYISISDSYLYIILYWIPIYTSDSYLYIQLLFIYQTRVYISDSKFYKSDSPIYISDSYLDIGLLFINRTPIYIQDCLYIGLLFINWTLLFIYRTPIYIIQEQCTQQWHYDPFGPPPYPLLTEHKAFKSKSHPAPCDNRIHSELALHYRDVQGWGEELHCILYNQYISDIYIRFLLVQIMFCKHQIPFSRTSSIDGADGNAWWSP